MARFEIRDVKDSESASESDVIRHFFGNRNPTDT